MKAKAPQPQAFQARLNAQENSFWWHDRPMFWLTTQHKARPVPAKTQRHADLQLTLFMGVGPIVQALIAQPRVMTFVVSGVVLFSVLWLMGALSQARSAIHLDRAGWGAHVKRAVLLGSAQAAVGCALIFLGGAMFSPMLFHPAIALISAGLATPVAMLLWLSMASIRAGHAPVELEA